MSHEARKGAFHIVTPPNEGLKGDMRRRIASQAGLSSRNVSDREIDVLRGMFDGGVRADSFTSSVHNKYLLSGRRSETVQQYGQSLEVMFDKGPNASSYGLYMPSYLRGLRSQKDRIGDHPHAAVLIGALTTDTIREYTTTVRDVYENSYCEVIDVEGDRTAQISPDIARFRYGNGLHLPFARSTVDSVHTNYLLGMLQDELGKEAPEKRTGIFQEAARVLRPEGVLLMVEYTDITQGQLCKELRDAGFSHVEICDAAHFKNRYQMELFLRSTAADPLQGATVQESASRFILARK